jgi:hypothetical protein
MVVESLGGCILKSFMYCVASPVFFLLDYIFTITIN